MDELLKALCVVVLEKVHNGYEHAKPSNISVLTAEPGPGLWVGGRASMM